MRAALKRESPGVCRRRGSGGRGDLLHGTQLGEDGAHLLCRLRGVTSQSVSQVLTHGCNGVDAFLLVG